MRAAVCRRYGPPDVVAVESWDAGPVGPADVRIRVAAAAVNFPDVLLIADRYQLSLPLPFVPGSELAGTVLEAGPEVPTLAPGDVVLAAMSHGAFAEEVVLPAASLRRIPTGVDLRAAAAFPVAHPTAYHVLRSVARLQPGEELVVLGAGGGVGLAAVELGAILGATVTAVASSQAKLDAAGSRGATRFVDHREGDLRARLRAALPDGADVVVDPVGGDLAEPALRTLRWGGRFVTVGYAAGEIPRIPLNLVLLKGISILGFQSGTFLAHAPDEAARNEAELLALLGQGRVRPHLGATFPLDDVVHALEHVATGRAVGKVGLVLEP